MIVVYTNDDERHPLDATGYGTDEHNNLEVMSGQKPLALFNKDHWDRVLVGEGDGEQGSD